MGALCIFCKKHQRFDVGASAFPEILLPFSKTQTCQLFDIIVKRVKRLFYTAKSRRANVYATWPHYIFSFCAYNSSWSLHGFTYQDQGLATARSLPPFFQLNMKQPGFTMAQIQVIINIQVSWKCSLQSNKCPNCSTNVRETKVRSNIFLQPIIFSRKFLRRVPSK